MNCERRGMVCFAWFDVVITFVCRVRRKVSCARAIAVEVGAPTWLWSALALTFLGASALVTPMPLRDSEAIILRSYSLGEADRLVSFLSRSMGRMRGVAQ
ncbi:MAG: recombination protein O N-terminal domain-containing protein, partial [Candidatus Acidiferrales bacterium]